MLKEKRDYGYCVPEVVYPYVGKFTCPVKDLNVDQYRALIDHDPINNRIYLELGINENNLYDACFFLEPTQALALANKLIKYATATIEGYDLIKEADKFIEIMTLRLKEKKIKDVKINPSALYTTNPEDELFGMMTMEVKYTTRDNNTYSIRLLSESMVHLTCDVYIKQINHLLRSYDVETITIDDYKLKSLFSKMKRILADYNKMQENRMLEENDIAPIQDLKEFAIDISNKIKEDLQQEKEEE